MFTRNMKIIEYDDDIISYEDIKTKNNWFNFETISYSFLFIIFA